MPTWGSAELEALASQTDPGIWKPKLGELVRQVLEGAVDEELVSPRIGSLRDKLLATMNDPIWQEKDRGGSSLSCGDAIYPGSPQRNRSAMTPDDKSEPRARQELLSSDRNGLIAGLNAQ